MTETKHCPHCEICFTIIWENYNAYLNYCPHCGLKIRDFEDGHKSEP